MKYLIPLLVLSMANPVLAQRVNTSYDAQYPLGSSEWVFVSYVYNPDSAQRHSDCQALAKAKYKADVTTRKVDDVRWACYKKNI